MEKKCGNCGRYNTFYTKGYCSFLREKFGYCSEHEKVMSGDEVCEHWRGRGGFRRNITRGVALRALEKGLTDIAAIRQIFSGEDEGEREQKTNENKNPWHICKGIVFIYELSVFKPE